jgi:hypothetical protein
VTGVRGGSAHELQRVMGKVWAQSIGSLGFGLGATGGGNDNGGEEERRRASGRQYRAIDTPRRGHRAA